MSVEPTTRAVLDQMTAAFPPVGRIPAAEARRRLRAQMPARDPEPVERVTDRTIPGPGGALGVRIYRPAPGPLPAVVFFHGGGWVLGDLDTYDPTCRSLANATGAVVVAVDHRLAPEHPFPAPLDDACAATAWVADNAGTLDIDAARLAVAGDSTGGNLAAATALRLRDTGGPSLAFQLLIYPVLSRDFDTASYRANADGWFLTRDHMMWFWSQYLPDSDSVPPDAAPLDRDDLGGLPPAHIVTAQHDPLRDEGEAYADRLREAGVRATSVCYGGAFHGFFSLGATLPVARQASLTAYQAVRDALAS